MAPDLEALPDVRAADVREAEAAGSPRLSRRSISSGAGEVSTIALDLDGTLLEGRWPEMGEWLPGAKEAVRTLVDAGHRCFIYSARLSPYMPDGSERDPARVMQSIQAVRDLLDDAGLREVDIWTGAGKPFWDVLVDDKAMWFP